MRLPSPSIPMRVPLSLGNTTPTTNISKARSEIPPQDDGTPLPYGTSPFNTTGAQKPRKFRVFTRSSLYSETASTSESITAAVPAALNATVNTGNPGVARTPSLQGDSFLAKHAGPSVNTANVRRAPRLPVLENVHQMAYLLDVIDNIPPSLSVLEPTRLRSVDQQSDMEELD